MNNRDLDVSGLCPKEILDVVPQHVGETEVGAMLRVWEGREVARDAEAGRLGKDYPDHRRSSRRRSVEINVMQDRFFIHSLCSEDAI